MNDGTFKKYSLLTVKNSLKKIISKEFRNHFKERKEKIKEKERKGRRKEKEKKIKENKRKENKKEKIVAASWTIILNDPK